jgi:hypothetical protein
VLVSNNPGIQRWINKIAAMTMHHAIPTMFSNRAYVAAGGLRSYDASITDSFRQVGVYVGRILKGEKPADLPVLGRTKFEFVLNLKVAKVLGLEIPLKLHAFADLRRRGSRIGVLLLRCMSPVLCRFSDAGNDDLTTRSKSAKDGAQVRRGLDQSNLTKQYLKFVGVEPVLTVEPKEADYIDATEL